MKRRRFLTLSLFVLLTASAFVAQEAGEKRKTIELDVYYRHDAWVMSPPVEDGADSTRSVFYSVLRAINPRTGQPFDTTQPSFPCDPADIQHSFRLEKKEFLLGEPVLIEHRIELNGAGRWKWGMGGNYRARGRDDNYFFVLRRADGLIVPDPDPSLRSFEGGYMGGGLFGSREITDGQPFSHWLALQRYSAITQPGTYDLYCLTGHKGFIYGGEAAKSAEADGKLPSDHYINENGFLIDRTTEEKSTRYDYNVNIHYLDEKPPPLIDLPPDVIAYAKEHSDGLPDDNGYGIGVASHFKIKIRKGSQSEQQQMAERWSGIFKSPEPTPVSGSRIAAALDAVWYAKQDAFLPLIKKWITGASDSDADMGVATLRLNGLVRRGDAAGYSLILKAPASEAVDVFGALPDEYVSDAIPLCIDWLTHTDSTVRSWAEYHLRRWTNRSFAHNWKDGEWDRPTLEEGKEMQTLWRAWWEKNKKTFKPMVKRSSSR
jgi:hypothetical protein